VEGICVCVCVCVCVTLFGEIKETYNIVDGKTEGNRSFERPGIRWIGLIKIVH
jgi:hypothetical protein